MDYYLNRVLCPSVLKVLQVAGHFLFILDPFRLHRRPVLVPRGLVVDRVDKANGKVNKGSGDGEGEF